MYTKLPPQFLKLELLCKIFAGCDLVPVAKTVSAAIWAISLPTGQLRGQPFSGAQYLHHCSSAETVIHLVLPVNYKTLCQAYLGTSSFLTLVFVVNRDDRHNHRPPSDTVIYQMGIKSSGRTMKSPFLKGHRSGYQQLSDGSSHFSQTFTLKQFTVTPQPSS